MSSLSGLLVLVVEDEALIAMVVADTLAGEDATVLGPAATVAAALRLMGRTPPHLAVVDVNLGGEMSTPVALALQRLAIPFLVTTGYQPDALPPPHQRALVLIKPCEPATLIAALQRTAQHARTAAAGPDP